MPRLVRGLNLQARYHSYYQFAKLNPVITVAIHLLHHVPAMPIACQEYRVFSLESFEDKLMFLSHLVAKD